MLVNKFLETLRIGETKPGSIMLPFTLESEVAPLIKNSIVDPDGFGHVHAMLANYFNRMGNQTTRDHESRHEQKKDQTQSIR